MGLTTFLLKIMWKPNYWSYCYEILHEKMVGHVLSDKNNLDIQM